MKSGKPSGTIGSCFCCERLLGPQVFSEDAGRTFPHLDLYLYTCHRFVCKSCLGVTYWNVYMWFQNNEGN